MPKINDDLLRGAKDRARAEYETNLGKVILVSQLSAYQHEHSIELAFDPPLRAVVEPSTFDSDIYRVLDGWLDPTWCIRPLEDRIPEGCSSFWVYATSWPVSAVALAETERRGTSPRQGADFQTTGEVYVEPIPDFVDFTRV